MAPRTALAFGKTAGVRPVRCVVLPAWASSGGPRLENGERPHGYASWRAGVRRRVRAGQSFLAQ
eukprot:7967115-Lingulodinium_polyedra.AAC.1